MDPCDGNRFVMIHPPRAGDVELSSRPSTNEHLGFNDHGMRLLGRTGRNSLAKRRIRTGQHSYAAPCRLRRLAVERGRSRRDESDLHGLRMSAILFLIHGLGGVADLNAEMTEDIPPNHTATQTRLATREHLWAIRSFTHRAISTPMR